MKFQYSSDATIYSTPVVNRPTGTQGYYPNQAPIYNNYASNQQNHGYHYPNAHMFSHPQYGQYTGGFQSSNQQQYINLPAINPHFNPMYQAPMHRVSMNQASMNQALYQAPVHQMMYQGSMYTPGQQPMRPLNKRQYRGFDDSSAIGFKKPKKSNLS